MLERGPDPVRLPDVAFVRAERMPSPEEQEHFAPIVPDLAVEVIFPTDRQKDVDEKIEQYLEAGVPLVWVFHLRQRTATVHWAGWPLQDFREGDALDGEEVLPGFRLPLADAFR